MRWQTATVAAFLAFSALAASGQPKVKIKLREQATVSSRAIRLCDIADVTALTEEGEKLLDTLKELQVAPSPLPRYSRIISSGEVATKLAQAGWRNGDFTLTGAKQVVVTRTGRTVSASELEAMLRKSFQTPVKILIPPPPIVVPEGELSVQAQPPSSPRSLLPVTLLVNGQPEITIKLVVQVPTTSSTTHRTALTTSHTVSLVARRQTVRLVVRVNSVVVEAQGMALQDGKLGDEVLVAVSWSKTALKGVVTGEREVTIPTWQ